MMDAAFWSLTGLACFETVLLMLIIFKTPALTFLKAAFRKRILLIHPRENHYIEIVPAQQSSQLAYVKGRGYYLIDPAHVYIEGSSKLPAAIVYGNFPLTLSPQIGKVAEALKSLGIKYYSELEKVFENLKNAGKTVELKIFGESVDLSQAIDMFSTSERSDLIEAEIQRRTAAQVIARLKTPENFVKWAMLLIMVVIGLVIAYGMLVSITGSGINLGSIVSGAKQALSPPSPAPRVVNATGVTVS